MRSSKLFEITLVVDVPWMTEREWEFVIDRSREVVVLYRPLQEAVWSLGSFPGEIKPREFDLETFRSLLKDADGLILGGGDKNLLVGVNPAEIKNLRYLGVHATGYEHIPESLILEAHRQLGNHIVVTRIPEYATLAVTEYVFAGILHLLRKPQSASHKFSGSQGPHRFGFPGGELLAGRQIVVFGMGQIGQAVTKIAIAFGATVVPIYKSSQKGRIALSEREEVDRVLQKSQIVSLNLPDIGEEVLDEVRLRSLPDGAIVVNSARPSLLDEEVLLKLVEAGKLRVVLDVLANPNLLPRWDKCVGGNRAIVTNHIAFNTPPSLRAKAELFIGNVLAYEKSLLTGVRGSCLNLVPFAVCDLCAGA